MYEKWKKRTRREVGNLSEDSGPTHNYNNNNNNSRGPNIRVNTKVRDELRSASEIKKLKGKKDDLKMKNMRKDKRTKLEATQRKNRKSNFEKYGNKKLNGAGASRKSKLIVRV